MTAHRYTGPLSLSVEIINLRQADDALVRELEKLTIRGESEFKAWLYYRDDVVAAVVRDGAVVVGWAALNRFNKHCDRVGVFVAPAYRGRGIARLAMTSLHDACPNTKTRLVRMPRIGKLVDSLWGRRP